LIGDNKWRDAKGNVCKETAAHFGDFWVESGLDAGQVWCPASARAGAKRAKKAPLSPVADNTSSLADDNPSDNGPDNDLVGIELGRQPATDDPTLIRLGSMLDALQVVCTANTRTQLADFTANVILLLDEDGVELKPTQVLEDAVTASDAYAAGGSGEALDCASLFALLVPLYKNGFN
jgi:hypothetical protein